MCGIVGAIARKPVTPILIEGLKRLEYRGYDSSGIAVLNESGTLVRVRKPGKIAELEKALRVSPVVGRIGIAHTRWATHGVPSERNAHPHVARDCVAVVHNGIIENHEILRQELKKRGHNFTSETDTETIVHKAHEYLEESGSLLQAVQKTVAELEGAYALGVISTKEPGHLIAARRGSPLVIGLSHIGNFIASDMFALVGETEHFIFLEDGDTALLSASTVEVYDKNNRSINRPIQKIPLIADTVERGKYRHYMQKEIHEQPEKLAATLEGHIRDGRIVDESFGPQIREVLDGTKEVQIVACGTSYHAGLIARQWLEEIAGIPCGVEVASEFRYRKHPVRPGTLFVSISQSGETADTLACLKEAKKLGYAHTLAVCNVSHSSIVRESDVSLMTRAGQEIGVASTKAFTTQLAMLLLLTLMLGKQNGLLEKEEYRIVNALEGLPKKINDVLLLEKEIMEWAKDFGDKEHALYLGRGLHHPVAMEGALKLKEISYIHAEAYPAGELKHGPLALIDDKMPVIAVAPNDQLFQKLKSNLQEVEARGGILYVFTNSTHLKNIQSVKLLHIGEMEDIIAPIVYTIPLQILAYHVALIKGTDVDQPRNLAKSVTVE